MNKIANYDSFHKEEEWINSPYYRKVAAEAQAAYHYVKLKRRKAAIRADFRCRLAEVLGCCGLAVSVMIAAVSGLIDGVLAWSIALVMICAASVSVGRFIGRWYR